MVDTITQTIWNQLVVPHMKLVRNEEGEPVGFVCEEFYTMTDHEFNTFMEAHVYLEEE